MTRSARVPARDANDVAADHARAQPAGDDAAAAAPSATVCTSALAGSDAGSATVPSLATMTRVCGSLRELLDRALDDRQARDAHRGAGLLGVRRRDDDV